MLKRVHVFAAACLGFPGIDAAVALEYCVTCEGPPAMYRCVVEGTEDGPGKDSSVSLYCMSQMAARGKHATCAVSRGAPFPCPGLTAQVKAPKDMPTPAAAPADSPSPQPAEPAAARTDGAAPTEHDAPPPAAEAPNKVPRTVEELAGQTVKSSQEGLKQAGDAIGGTAKKAGEHIGNAASTTWNCITSLFSTCSSEPEQATQGHTPDAADGQLPDETTSANEHPAN